MDVAHTQTHPNTYKQTQNTKTHTNTHTHTDTHIHMPHPATHTEKGVNAIAQHNKSTV